jgi:DeoR family glycerol-3-phosphate regulon repressor
MRVYPRFEVVIAGGVVRPSDGGIVGEAAAGFFSQFKTKVPCSTTTIAR